jgi:hypothetical protein
MTKEDIMKLVRDSYEQGQFDLMESCKEVVVKAIEAAMLAEREACVRVCEEEIARVKPIYSVVAENVLKGIRARSSQPATDSSCSM